MEFKNEIHIPASRETVWQALNDPEVLKECIPGCQEIAKTSDTEFAAKVVVSVGPVKAPFKGKVTLSDLDPPNGYKIAGQGQSGVAGFARGEATVRLSDEAGATLLTYEAQAVVGGKIAQVGGRLIDITVQRMTKEFFGKFSEAVAAPAEAAAEAAPAPAPSGVSPWVWVGAAAVALVALLLIFAR